MSAHIHEPDVEAVIGRYFDALRTGDTADLPLSEEVGFERIAMGDRLVGRDTVRAFIGGHAERIDRLDVDRTIVEGNHACALFTWRTPRGAAVMMCDYFQFERGAIRYVRPYFDPRPLLDESTT